ncbi:hypothetical protein PZ897_11665 [Hoeflea sp. YIM 152468]|nr:hypothetical protein [Hoeflea sp. YIM 152468]MDF1608834.1 hypothetical protein [Hoeflea sp. YIM 152468]
MQFFANDIHGLNCLAETGDGVLFAQDRVVWVIEWNARPGNIESEAL